VYFVDYKNHISMYNPMYSPMYTLNITLRPWAIKPNYYKAREMILGSYYTIVYL